MAATQQIETRPGIAYANHDGVSLAGDLYLPAGPGPFPALVGVHGGGWQAGVRSTFQYWGAYLAARGYALFAISYRLAKKGHTNSHANKARGASTAVSFASTAAENQSTALHRRSSI